MPNYMVTYAMFGIFNYLIERIIDMYERKNHKFKSPDLTNLQEVVIDYRTRIYIAVGADPEEARNRYLSRLVAKRY
jgi:hypothetical protein